MEHNPKIGLNTSNFTINQHSMKLNMFQEIMSKKCPLFFLHLPYASLITSFLFLLLPALGSKLSLCLPFSLCSIYHHWLMFFPFYSELFFCFFTCSQLPTPSFWTLAYPVPISTSPPLCQGCCQLKTRISVKGRVWLQSTDELLKEWTVWGVSRLQKSALCPFRQGAEVPLCLMQ